MKRKYLSALLMGALTVTSVSTFTSCKDYDSDISNLQGQIDKAALSTDVQALKSQVETAASNASSAISTAENALAEANNLGNDLDLLADEVQANASTTADALERLAGNDAALADSITALQAANKKATKDAADAIAKANSLDAKLTEAIEKWGESKEDYITAVKVDEKLAALEERINAATADSIANLKKVVDGYKAGINALYTAVTEVTIVTSGTEYTTNLKFTSGVIAVDDYTFGAKEVDDKKVEHSATPTYTYKKNATYSFPTDVLVRVNPVNAKIDASMIKLIDSKGGDLSNLLEVSSVEKFDEYLTTTTKASETGLWIVSLKTKDGVKSADLAAAKVDGNSKLYALAINNTAAQAEAAEDAASRYVVSGYDLTVGAGDAYVAQKSLDNVKVWAASKPGDAKTLDNVKDGAKSTKKAVNVQNGEDILVSFEDKDLSKVDRFYVVRDDAHAGEGEESQTSEINAWNSYVYNNGLNKVIEVKNGYGKDTLNVKINGQVGDEIQFRVFAINYNGELVEKNGRAFRVYIGAQTTKASVEGNLVGTATPGTMSTAWLPISGSLTADAKIIEKDEVTLEVDGQKFTGTVDYAQNAEGTVKATKGSEAKYMKVTVSDIAKWPNGKQATGVIEDENSPVVNSITVSLTKVLPTVDTAKGLVKYTWKDKQLVDGTYTAYVYPSDDHWYTNAPSGVKKMNQAITDLDDNCIIVVDNAKVKDNAGVISYPDPLVVYSDTNWELSAFNLHASDGTYLIDGTTKHKSYIKYNFGLINSEKPTENYIVTIEEYNTVFACPLSETAQKYAWTQWEHYDTSTKVTTKKDVNVLTYGSTNTVKNVNLLDYIKGTNAFDNTVFGGALSGYWKGQANTGSKYVTGEAHLISKGSGKEDYFKVDNDEFANGKLVFIPQSDATNPTGDVPSTLVLKLTDTFGHENVYNLDFTVKRAE